MKLRPKPSIQQADNFFPEEIAKEISAYLRESLYRYGETDNQSYPPTGLVADLYHIDAKEEIQISDETKLIYNYFIKHIHEKYTGFWNDYAIYRLYINVFAPKEQAYFHTDSVGESDQWTFIWYPMNFHGYDINQGGCTEFSLDNKIIGVPPFPNSLVRFSSNILHRATPFRDHHRFSIAIKCMNKKELTL
tara:strand:- start:4400 stop:4972 length:573 start_codon:yes stop_codon:yes gene_type:complete